MDWRRPSLGELTDVVIHCKDDAEGQAFKNYTRYNALNVVWELKAKVMKTACPLPNWARGQAISLVRIYGEIQNSSMRTDLRSQTSSQCHQENCLPSAKLGNGAGLQLGGDIWGNTEFIHEDRFEEPNFLPVSP